MVSKGFAYCRCGAQVQAGDDISLSTTAGVIGCPACIWDELPETKRHPSVDASSSESLKYCIKELGKKLSKLDLSTVSEEETLKMAEKLGLLSSLLVRFVLLKKK